MSTFEERARSRRAWPVVKTDLADDRPPRGPEDPTDAWNAVLELTREAYALAGIHPAPLPRSKWPVRLFRPGEPRLDTNGL
jgi:hypothetical protein